MNVNDLIAKRAILESNIAQITSLINIKKQEIEFYEGQINLMKKFQNLNKEVAFNDGIKDREDKLDNLKKEVSGLELQRNALKKELDTLNIKLMWCAYGRQIFLPPIFLNYYWHFYYYDYIVIY